MISFYSPRSGPMVAVSFALFLLLVWVCQTLMLWDCKALILGVCHYWIMMLLNAPSYIEALFFLP